MSNLVPVIDSGGLDDFLDRSPVAVLHLDADWDGGRLILSRRMEELIDLNPDVSFGYIDIDQHQDHARAVGLRNVPACSYYRGRTLVATVIGMNQDISLDISIMRSGGVPDTSNRISRP